MTSPLAQLSPLFRMPIARRARRRTAPVASPRVRTLTTEDLAHPAPLVLTAGAYRALRRTIGAQPAETGGPLGGHRGSGVVEHLAADPTARRNSVQYYPDQHAVNALLRERWNPVGVNLLGFAHSHPYGAVRPSGQDLRYATQILDAIPELDRLLLPIVQSSADGPAFDVHGYAAVRRGRGVELEVIPVRVASAASRPDITVLPEFARVHDAYHLPTMAAARVIAVGCGGSAGFLADLARAGVGEFVLIDPDTVAPENVGTQAVYRSDIGRPKVSALAERLVDISPHARVWVVQASLDDLDDASVRRLALGWLPGADGPRPGSSLLCAFTDAFAAQARVARLGLHLGVPVVGGMVYAEGRGVELTFAAPRITPACIRCAQRSRYVAYLEQGFVNTIGSAGTPIAATARLNALKLPVAVSLLHRFSDVASGEHPAVQRSDRLLDAISERNLVIASLDPDAGASLGLRVFDQLARGDSAGRLPVDTTAWLRQQPDRPEHGFPRCPDCGGTGNLGDSMGRFLDTRLVPLAFGDFRH